MASKGTMNNPYTMEEYEKLLDEGKWSGGYVKDDGGVVTYIMKDISVSGYSTSSGSYDYGSIPPYTSFSGETSYWWSGNNSNSGNENGNSGNQGSQGSGGGGGNSGGYSYLQSEISSELRELYLKLPIGMRNILRINKIKIVYDESYALSDSARYTYNAGTKTITMSSTNLDALRRESIHACQDHFGMLDSGNSNLLPEFHEHIMGDIYLYCNIREYISGELEMGAYHTKFNDESGNYSIEGFFDRCIYNECIDLSYWEANIQEVFISFRQDVNPETNYDVNAEWDSSYQWHWAEFFEILGIPYVIR